MHNGKLSAASSQTAPSGDDWLSAVNSLDDLVMIVDLRHRILAANSAVTEITGLSEKEIVTRTCCQIFHHTDTPPAACPLEVLKQLPSPQTTSIEMKLLDRVCQVTATPIFDSHGKLVKAACTSRDITGRDKASRELEKANRALRTLSECNKILARPLAEQEMLQQICRVIVEEGGYHLTWIGSALDDAEKTVHPLVHWGFDHNYLESIKIVWADNELGQGPTGTAIRTGRPVACQNILTDPRFTPWREEAQKRDYSSSVSLPLLVNEKTIGALNIYAVEQDCFAAQELGLLQGLASDISYGIITRRIAQERKKTESEMAKRASEWTFAMDFIEDAVYLLDLDDRIIHANSSFYKLIDSSPEQAIGKDICSIMHPLGEAAPCPACQARRERRDAVIIMEADHPANPAGRPIQVMVKIIRDGNYSPLSVIMGIRDLSPLEELRKQAQIINQIKEAVITTDPEGIVTTWNNGAEKLLGFARQEAVGKRISFLQIHREADPRQKERVNGKLFAGSHREARILRKSGTPIHALISSSDLLSQSGEKKGTIFTITDISDRKIAEIKLMESEERFRLLIENTSDWIWEVDEAGNFTYASPKVRELLGYEPEELIGTSPFALMPADEAARVIEMFDQMAAAREPFTGMENTNRHRNGHLVVLESSGVPIFDEYDNFRGYRGVDRDITARKEVEKNRANQASMWALGSDIGQAITTAGDLRLMVQKCCEAFVQRLDAAFSRIWIFHPMEKMLILEGSAGMYTHLDGLHGRIALNSDYKIALIATTHRPHLTNQVIGDPQIKDQQWAQREKMVAFAGHPLLVGDRLVGVMAMFSRIPLSDFILKTFESVADKIAIGIDNKLAEQEKAVLQKQIRQMQKMQAIGTLAGGIAHDFNNILTAILGYGDLLKHQLDGNADAQDCAEQILLAGNRAKNLVRQILTFSRQTEQERHPLYAHLIVKEAIKLLRASIPAFIRIKEDIDPKCGTIMADPTELHQIVMNLCTNAYHAMQDQGGIMEVKLQKVQITAELAKANPRLHEGEYAVLEVRDTGCGMDPLLLERIFEPYFTTKQPGEGTGMGLALVHGIVEGLDGAIVVDSTLGRGSTFAIYLPILETQKTTESQANAELIPGGNERILFVDDEETIVSLSRKQLLSLGYDVTATTSSQEALKLFAAAPHSIDLVITDQMMPHMTGTEFSRKLITIRPDIPIILLTGFSHTLMPDQAKKIGIREFAMKPLLTNELAQIIRKVLEEK
ncbi:MAG: PAS domain S-box protein [Proteobacteria bacterium]|nr:PAS domain S-box protein [Pseudomonadota bacterium]MBU4298069.1 PAS domain S-box protein [Pseudomonadota bacterium]MCG2746956.1 PAS domain S-box protein [Desulfobulbaceae bacterium]